MKYLKKFESYYQEIDKIRLNSPCTIFLKSKKHVRDVKITKEESEHIEWIANAKNSKKSGKVEKSEIVDISYQND